MERRDGAEGLDRFRGGTERLQEERGREYAPRGHARLRACLEERAGEEGEAHEQEHEQDAAARGGQQLPDGDTDVAKLDAPGEGRDSRQQHEREGERDPSGTLREEGPAAERLRQQQIEGTRRLLARDAARARKDADDDDDDRPEVEVVGAQEALWRADVGAAPEGRVEGAARQVVQAVSELLVFERDHHAHQRQRRGGHDHLRAHPPKRLAKNGQTAHAEPSRS